MHHHTPSAHHHVKYFEGKLSRGFMALFYNQVISSVATGLFAVFLPIFLYTLFKENVAMVAGYYLATYIVYLIFLLVASPFLNKIGFRRALRISTLVAVLFYTCLFFLNENNLLYLLPMIIFLIGFWRFLYWTPYNVDMAKFTSKKDRAKELSFMDSILSIISIITPIVAGLVIVEYGFNLLFLIGVFVFAFSVFPLMFVPRTKEKFSWGRIKTIKKVFNKENRIAAAIFFADGAEGIIGGILWPIFIFQLLNGDYLKVGIISTLVVAVTIIMQLIAGKYADQKGKLQEQLFKFGGIFYAIGWILKIFVLTAFHVFIIDAFHRISQVFYRVPLDTFVYEKAKDQKHLIDEFNIFRNIAISFGRIFMITTVLVMSFYLSLNWLFLFGAVFSIFLSIAHNKLSLSLR
jgi:YQGE family putative transporter